jgi:hypothetical protein
VRAGNQAKRQNEGYEGGTCGERIGEKSDRRVSSGKLLRHDPRADHGCEQQGGSNRFGAQASR